MIAMSGRPMLQPSGGSGPGFDMTQYQPRYWLVNGLPDTIAPNYTRLAAFRNPMAP